MNPARLQETFAALCRIPSPTGKEGRVAEWIRRRVQLLGCDVREDRSSRTEGAECSGNLYIRLKHNAPFGKRRELPLFLSAHMDTVPVPFEDEIPVRIEGDRIDTGGACPLGADDKSGIAIALELLESAVEHPQRLLHPLELILTVREEVGVQGGGLVDPNLVTARQGFNLDGETPVYSAISRGTFKLRFAVDVRGKSSHAALNPEDGVNAIKAAAAIVDRLPAASIDDRSTANIGRIEGGGATNVVPECCTIVGELRSLDEPTLAFWRRKFESIITETAALTGTRADVEWEELYRGFRVDETEPCVSLFRDAVGWAGHTPLLLSSRGGGDANYLNAKGLRCIVLGLGMENIHSPREFYLFSRLEEAASLLERIFFAPNP